MTIRQAKRRRQRESKRDMLRAVNRKGVTKVAQIILAESEMEDTADNLEWVKKYVRKIAFG